MTHADIELLLLGSLIPNNLLLWIFRPLYRHGRRRRHHHSANGFSKFAQGFGDAFGSAPNFILWLLLLVAWVAVGSSFHWNNTWQLMANTPTTWLELFAAITIQYVGNRIERRQELHEKRMQATLDNIEARLEPITSIIDHDPTFGR